MAKYTVIHTCDHSQEYQLYGKTDLRRNKIEWLETQLCPDCARAERDKRNAEINKKTAAANAAAGLPNLKGTHKQIAWAETIRQEKIEAVKNFDFGGELTPGQQELFNRIVAAFQNQTDAAYWISLRGKSPLGLMHVACEIAGVTSEDLQNA
jgi:hypothetical protein